MGGTWPSGVSWSENKQLAEQMAGRGCGRRGAGHIEDVPSVTAKP